VVEDWFVVEVPEQLIGHKAYATDRLDERTRDSRGIERIAPHRRTRRQDSKTQDGR
jgi:hypothetical protein